MLSQTIAFKNIISFFSFNKLAEQSLHSELCCVYTCSRRVSTALEMSSLTRERIMFSLFYISKYCDGGTLPVLYHFYFFSEDESLCINVNCNAFVRFFTYPYKLGECFIRLQTLQASEATALCLTGLPYASKSGLLAVRPAFHPQRKQVPPSASVLASLQLRAFPPGSFFPLQCSVSRSLWGTGETHGLSRVACPVTEGPLPGVSAGHRQHVRVAPVSPSRSKAHTAALLRQTAALAHGQEEIGKTTGRVCHGGQFWSNKSTEP